MNLIGNILCLYIIHGESLLGDFQAYMGCFKVWHNLTRVLKPCTNHPELNIFWMYKSFSPFSSSDCNIYLYHWPVYLFSIKRACKSCLFFKYLKLWRKINKLIMWFSTTQQQDTLVAHPDLNPIDYWCPHSWTIVAVLHAKLVIQTPLLYCRYQQLGL